MNDDPQIEAMAFVPPPFPTWPPSSGGAPFAGTELGPITNPFPYGSTQPGNISIAPPIPVRPYSGTFWPRLMTVGATGQNQQKLPLSNKPWEVGPIKAPPSLSQIQPPPIMGPGPQGVGLFEMGPLAGTPPPTKTFPAGSYIDGLGTVVTPTRTIGGLGN